MKIGIDISQIVYGTGTSVYIKKLVEELLKIDRSNQYVLFGSSLRRQIDLGNFINQLPPSTQVDKKIYPFPPVALNYLWNSLHILPVETFIGKVDIFHSSDWTMPPSSSLKITTIHDLAPILFPKETHPRIREVHKRRLKWVKREANAVIVPSESTKKDVIEFGISEKIIHVVPEAPFIVPIKENFAEFEGKYKDVGSFLLAVGVNKRKNTKRIIEAYKKIRKSTSIVSLIIVGHSEESWTHEEGVITTGHVSDSELSFLYSNAEALVYPSLYEGFGIPIVEAFTFGCPVVTSNLSAMSEVAGGAASLVDPYDVNSIIQGVEHILKKRKEFVEKGKKRAKEFSWKKNAEETFKIYNSLKE